MGKVPLIGAIVLALVSCRDSGSVPHREPVTGGGEAGAEMKLPEGPAGDVLRRAIEAAGGWKRWRGVRDVSFVSTLNLFNAMGSLTSSATSFHRALLHHGWRSRVESIGNRDEMVLGIDGPETWLLRNGHPFEDTFGAEFGRFNAVSSLFWLGLPFVLAEYPAEIQYVGATEEGALRLERIRVVYAAESIAPADWLVLYFDAETGLIQSVWAEVRAEFLRHRLWIGRWRDFRDWNGIRAARRRTFFPADRDARVIGTMTAEHFLEHLRFDNGFPVSDFEKPSGDGGGGPAT